jgi:hypothetical protein
VRVGGSGNGTSMSGVERILQHGTALLVGGSGLAFAWMKYLLPPAEDPFTAFHHPLQPLMLQLHVLAAPLLVLAIGMITRDHILARIRNRKRRRGRRSGILAAATLVPMIASGYLLQTVTSEVWHRWILVVHLVSGGLFLVAYVAHLVVAVLAARRAATEGVCPAQGGAEPQSLHLRAGRPVEAAWLSGSGRARTSVPPV